MVSFNDNFKYDLQFGQIREQRIADILLNETIEVKTERGQWVTSGNIAIEQSYKGKPSGIASTEAKYWMHILENNGVVIFTLLFRTYVLKQLIKSIESKCSIIPGGDNKESQLILVPLHELIIGDALLPPSKLA